MAAAFLCVLAMASCSKDGVKGFEGRYSYKISGKVALLPTDYVNASAEEKQMMEAMGITFTPVWVPLYPEQGQMHINVKDKDDNLAIITFNDIFGNVCSAEANIESDVVTIVNDAEKTAVLTDGSEKIGSGFVTWRGSGNRYGDQIIINLEYNGTMTLNDTGMTIVESKVECVATKN